MSPPLAIKEEYELIPSPPTTITSTTCVSVITTEASQTLKKGPWTAAEDAVLIEYVKQHGEGNWNAVQKNIGLQRCGKSCRLRWANHLRPNLKKGSFSPEEEHLILILHAQIGNKWARMAAQMPGRTDNEIKNYWNTRIKRRQRAGLPLYPTEIKPQEPPINQKLGKLFYHQNQISPNSLISHISPTTTTTLFNNDTNSGSVNYLLGNFNFNQQPQQLQSSAYSIKMEPPSTQLLTSYVDEQNIQHPPSMPQIMGQGNNVLYEDMFQESQGHGEIFNEGFLFEPVTAGCDAITECSSSSVPSNSKQVMSPFCKVANSDISFGIHVMKEPVVTMVNKNVSNIAEINRPNTTIMPMEKIFSADWWITEDKDDIRVKMHQLASLTHLHSS